MRGKTIHTLLPLSWFCRVYGIIESWSQAHNWTMTTPPHVEAGWIMTSKSYSLSYYYEKKRERPPLPLLPRAKWCARTLQIEQSMQHRHRLKTEKDTRTFFKYHDADYTFTCPSIVQMDLPERRSHNRATPPKSPVATRAPSWIILAGGGGLSGVWNVSGRRGGVKFTNTLAPF